MVTSLNCLHGRALYGEDSEDDAGALDEEEASGAEGGAASDGDADEVRA